jgi:hypothetical protein
MKGTTHLIATAVAALLAAAPAIAQQSPTATQSKTQTTVKIDTTVKTKATLYPLSTTSLGSVVTATDTVKTKMTVVTTPDSVTATDTTVKTRTTTFDLSTTTPDSNTVAVDTTALVSTDAVEPKAKSTVASRAAATQPQIVIQHIRPVDQRGINVFESPKIDNTAYDGFKLQWGVAFTQQFQGLDHKNTALPKPTTPVGGTTYDANKLIQIGHGFNNAEANLYMNAQLAKGIRVSLTSYLSTRHHNETWVKDGYLLVDDSPIKWEPLENLMQFVTVKVGHFEINYGDSHFRRTDGGNAMYNPFVGNLIMDAFTTEVGGEVYVRLGALMAMGGITGGEVRGMVAQPQKRSPSFLGKVGFDRQVMSDLRLRLTGSMYTTKHSVSNTLYSGDRSGSRYYDVLENVNSTEAANAWSGAIQPGQKDNITATVINPFVKFRGLEYFGNIETSKGKAATETADRTWNQLSNELVYRFLPAEQVWVGARYNTASGKLAVTDPKETVKRTQLSAGWFITPGLMGKIEYVNQKYDGFVPTDIRNGGNFKGFLVEGTVAF